MNQLIQKMMDAAMRAEWSSLLLTAAALFALYRFVSAVYLLFVHPLSKYPGPKLWAISRIPWAKAHVDGDFWIKLQALHERYGPIVRIAPDELSTVSPTAWREIYASQPLLLKDQFVQTPPLNGAHTPFTAEGADHRRIRGALASAFSDKALREQAPLLQEHADTFISKVRAEADAAPDRVVDIGKWFADLAMDSISDLAFGEPFGAMHSGKPTSMLAQFFIHARFSATRSSLTRFTTLWYILQAILLRMTKTQRRLNWQLADDRIGRRLALEDKHRPDFVAPLVGKLNEDGRSGMSRKELTSSALSLTIANSQLVTALVTDAVFLLLKHPATLRHVREEVDKAGFASSGDINTESTEQLTYLKAVIDETLRIHHPSPMSLVRIVSETRVVDGQVMPAKSYIGVNPQTIQNYSGNFEAAGEFHPERFMPPGSPLHEPRFDADLKAAFRPFSVGPRNCIGERNSRAQARLVLAKVLFNFDLALAMNDTGELMGRRAWMAFEPTPLRVVVKDRRVKT